MEEIITAAVTAHKEGRVQDAEEHYLKAIELDPGAAHPRYLLGVLSFQMKDLTSARSRLIEATNIDESHASYFCALAQSALAMHHHREAIAAFEKALRLNPDYIEAYTGSAISAARLKQFDITFQLLNQAFELAPESANIHLSYALCFREQKSWQWMETASLQALKYEPNNIRASMAYIESLIEQSRLDEAEQSYLELEDSEYPIAETFFIAGRIACLREHYREAEDLFRKCYENNYYHFESCLSLGLVCQKRGHPLLAHHAHKLAFYVAPENRDVQLALARTAVLIGDSHWAFGLLHELVTTDPECSKTSELLKLAAEGTENAEISETVQFSERADTVGGSPEITRVQNISNDEAEFKSHMEIAQKQLPGQTYTFYLEALHRFIEPSVYLEIGVESPQCLSLAQPGTIAIGINPVAKITHDFRAKTRIFDSRSDDFFAGNMLDQAIEGNEHIDLAFIKGAHVFDQVLRDFIHIEENSGRSSVLIIHNCYPLDERSASSRKITEFWTGDTWKMIACLKEMRPEIQLFTIKTFPSGLAVITNLNAKSTVLRDGYNDIVKKYSQLPYSFVGANKDKLLNAVENDWSLVREKISGYLHPGGKK